MQFSAESITDWLRRESGQDLAEYGLLLLLVAVAAVAAITLLGPTISELFNSTVSSWPS